MVNYLNTADDGMLKPGQELIADNGRVKLSAMPDGNVLVYATVGGDPFCLWATNTKGSYNRFCVNGNNGELCIFTQEQGGDTLWKNGCWNSGKSGPYTLRMQDDGNLVVSSNDGTIIWQTGTHVSQAPIEFSQVKFVNDAHGVVINPQIRDANGGKVLWDGGDYEGFTWAIADGQSQTVDLRTNTARAGVIPSIGDFIGDGRICALGFDVVYGDDDWVDPIRKYQFKYSKSIGSTVIIRKYGGLRHGDAVYDGHIYA